MLEEREWATSAMFEGDDSIWWITGGNSYPDYDSDTTEIFGVKNNSFACGVDLPKELEYHNLVNVNQTHMVLLGGQDLSDEIYIIDRYTVINYLK